VEPEKVLTIIGVIVGSTTILTLAFRGLRTFARAIRKFDEFMDDWNGTAARPGVKEQAGIMARLEIMEARLKSVEHEVVTNQGSSLKDAVARIETRLQSNPAMVKIEQTFAQPPETTTST